jgi:hypothetical protein
MDNNRNIALNKHLLWVLLQKLIVSRNQAHKVNANSEELNIYPKVFNVIIQSYIILVDRETQWLDVLRFLELLKKD